MIVINILCAIILYIAAYFLFYIICSLCVNKNKEYNKVNKFYRVILNHAAFIATKILRIKIHISGKEKLSENQSYLFVSNHRSNLDPILSWYAFKEHNIAYISKIENFSVPIFGNIIHRCCFLPIDRKEPAKAIHTINKAAEYLQKQEFSIGIYPEGTRNRNKELLPFHNGVFRIAQKSSAPIVVFSIRNTDDVNKNYPFKSTDVYIDILDVIPVDEIKGIRTNILGDRIKDTIANHLNKKAL